MLDDGAVDSKFELGRVFVNSGVGDEVTQDFVLALGQMQGEEQKAVLCTMMSWFQLWVLLCVYSVLSPNTWEQAWSGQQMVAGFVGRGKSHIGCDLGQL